MTILVTKRGRDKVLHLFPDTYEEQQTFKGFHKLTKPCTIEFVDDAAYSYPHIEISKEVL